MHLFISYDYHHKHPIGSINAIKLFVFVIETEYVLSEVEN
jgi:hypothetical protein